MKMIEGRDPLRHSPRPRRSLKSAEARTCFQTAQTPYSGQVVRRRNSRASRRHGNCRRMAHSFHPRRTGNGYSSVRPGRLGGCRKLRKARSAQEHRAISRRARGQSRALQITQSRTMEAFRHARGARRRKSPANPAHDGRARPQSRFADRAHSRAQEIKSSTRHAGPAPIFTRRRGLATTQASQIRPVFLHRGRCTNSSRLEVRPVHSRP